MDEVVNVRNDGISSESEKELEARTLKLRASLLKDKPVALKRKKSAGCNMEIVGRKVADIKSKVNNLANGLRRTNSESFASIRHNVDQKLLAVGSRPKTLLDREAQELQ